MKNNLVINALREVLYLSETYEGSMHDKAILDEESLAFPKGVTLYQDAGFQGHHPEGVTLMQPAKKPRGRELTDEQKAQNKAINAKRVLIEHAIGSVKVFRIVKDTNRNWKANFRDVVMALCCGLHNLKVQPVT